MSRIEFKDTEQKMADLKGFNRITFDPKQNGYTTDKLDDDEFNYISGMNYVISWLTDNFLDNYLFDLKSSESNKTIRKLKQEIAKETIEEFADYGFSHISELITSFIDSHEEEVAENDN